KTETLSGGQAKSLPLITTPRENTLVLGEQLPTEGRFDYAPEQPWEYTYDGTQEPRGKLGGAVVFSDSFFDALHRSGINTYFSSVHKARLYSAELEEIYRQIPDGTRYLIIEFIEPAMIAFMVNGFSVPEADEQAPVPAN
nr:hypothetical protein [Xanthomonadales bacterium]NIX12557.1 hypothetical protein [Xanthomonadales bacterium]